MSTQRTVEVRKDGSIVITGADEYESGELIRQSLLCMAEMKKTSAREKILTDLLPIACLAPMVLVLWATALILLRPSPPMPVEQNTGSYQSYVSP